MFKYTPELKKLTINECRKLLGEKMHRTDFLDGLKKDVFGFIVAKTKEMIGENAITSVFVYNKPNCYFHKLTIHITLKTHDGHGGLLTGNHANYINESGLRDGKLENPCLDVMMEMSTDGSIMEWFAESSVSHEINHLYDDWVWQNCGHEPIELNGTVNDRNNLAQGLMKLDSDLANDIGYCFYLSIWTEENSFINQTDIELSALGCNRHNVQEMIKKTTAYHNYNKTYTDLQADLDKCAVGELAVLNNLMWHSRKQCKSPCMDPGCFSVDEFKERLVKWCEGIRRHFMKRYCGAVQFYLDRQMAAKVW